MVDDLMLTLSPDPQPIFPSSSLEYDAVSSSDPSSDEDDDEEVGPPLNDAVPDPYSSPSSSDLTIPSSAVTVAITPPPTATITTLALPTTAAATTPLDSRRLFQRLWTDEDEMELLQGFLAYTSTRGPTPSGHYHDTSAFYDQIKSKLQLPFNKNQLVEKLRRLKKKYRTNLAKINSSNSSKHFIFKSPHDQATFDISSKIWSHLSATFDADPIPISIHNHNPNPHPPVTLVAAATPLPKPSNSSYVISHINLNSGTPPATGYDTMLTSLTGNGGGLPKLCTRKRSRITTSTPTGKFEEKFANTDGGISLSNTHIACTENTPPPPPPPPTANNNNNNSSNNNVGAASVGVSSPLQGLIEETLRNCLSPVLKELISSAVNCTTTGTTTGLGGGGGSPGFKGAGALGLNAVPLNYSGVAVGGICVEGGIDEKWRKQQILELEVYSKRLELVQEQIKLSLEELRSMQS